MEMTGLVVRGLHVWTLFSSALTFFEYLRVGTHEDDMTRKITRNKCIFQLITDGVALVPKMSRHFAESNRSFLNKLACVSTMQVFLNGKRRTYVLGGADMSSARPESKQATATKL
jgi:hypothetical protein